MSTRTMTRENAKQRMDGPLHQFSIEDEVRSLRSESEYLVDQQNQITLVHEGPLRVATFVFRKGSGLRNHVVSGPIALHLLSGRIALSCSDGRSIEMAPGNLLSLAGGITHNVEALEDSTMLLTVVQVGEPAKQNENEWDQAPLRYDLNQPD